MGFKYRYEHGLALKLISISNFVEKINSAEIEINSFFAFQFRNWKKMQSLFFQIKNFSRCSGLKVKISYKKEAFYLGGGDLEENGHFH